MYVGIFKGCYFEHTELSIYFLAFNDECVIVKEAKDANLLSQESKRITHHIFSLSWASPRENLSSGGSDKARFKPVSSATETS